MTDHLRRSVAEDVDHPFIGERYALIRVDDPDALMDRLDEAAVADLALAQSLTHLVDLGDVTGEALDGDDVAIIVANIHDSHADPYR